MIRFVCYFISQFCSFVFVFGIFHILGLLGTIAILNDIRIMRLNTQKLMIYLSH